jgi:hypothetical protein
MHSFLSSARHQVGMDLKRNRVREHGKEKGKKGERILWNTWNSNCLMHVKLRDDLMLLVKNDVEERKEGVGFIFSSFRKWRK